MAREFLGVGITAIKNGEDEFFYPGHETANQISVDTTNFDNLLTPNEDTVQKCFDKINDFSANEIPNITEFAQDAIGNILTNTWTINWTYDDINNIISSNINYQMSIDSDSFGIKLKGDIDEPGLYKFYGTNENGIKGWYGLQGIYGNMIIYNPFSLDFTHFHREHIKLFTVETDIYYSIGTQPNTVYTRSQGGFAWYKSGKHDPTSYNPGIGGSVQMLLHDSGNLIIGSDIDDGINKLQINGTLKTNGIHLPDGLHGDIIVRDGNNFNRLPPGIPGEVLITKGAGMTPEWGQVSLQGSSGVAGGFNSGGFFDNAKMAKDPTVRLFSYDEIIIAPITVWKNVTMDLMGVYATKDGDSPLSNQKLRLLIYDTDQQLGWPDSLIYQSSELQIDRMIFISEIINVTFQGGKTYWVGIHTKNNPEMRSIHPDVVPPLGLDFLNNQYYTVLQQYIPFANGAPSTWTMNDNQFLRTDVVSIRFRISN